MLIIITTAEFSKLVEIETICHLCIILSLKVRIFMDGLQTAPATLNTF